MISFEGFVSFAESREKDFETIKDLAFVKQAYDYAFNNTQNLTLYFQQFQLEAYCYNLAIHLIILTATEDNPLFSKYFPDSAEDERLKNYGTIIGSVSDSTSSVSNMAYAGLNNLSVEDAMLMLTPYGAFVKTLNDSLKNVIVVV